MVWDKIVNPDTGYLKPLNDTKFYCCETMQSNLAGVPLAEYYYKQELKNIKYCPFCGTRMNRNYG